MKPDREHIRPVESPEPPARLRSEQRSTLAASEPTLPELARMLLIQRWTIAACCALALAGAGAYLAVADPIYRADVVIQVEDKTKTIAGLDEIASVFSEKTPAETEIEIIRSRRLVGAVVDQLRLDVDAEAIRVPLLGSAFAVRGDTPAPPRFGLDRFAWGGERIRVDRLVVPEELYDKELVLTAGEGGAYRLEAPDGTALLDGTVGVPARPPEGGPEAELLVAELVARPGTRFAVSKEHRADVIEQLQKRLSIEEKGKKTGILQVSLEGTDRREIAAVLNAIGATYLRHNVDRKSAEAKATLEFLETQLPLVKATLEQSETQLKQVQAKKGLVSLSQETQALLERQAVIERELSELELERTGLRQRFTASHPSVVGVSQKIEKLQAQRAAAAARMRSLPEEEHDTAKLTRDIKVSSELYTLLLNRTEEMRVLRSGVVGNISVLDEALVPPRPVRPKAVTVLVLALLVGIGGGIAAAFVRQVFAEGADDPEEIERNAGISVFVAIPHSARADALARAAKRARVPTASVLAAASPGDVAVEAIRSLRTALQLSLAGARSNVVAIAAPAPDAGKSFVCSNLAVVLAAAGRRVLLVDADLRRGTLHRIFGVERFPGLMEVLTGALPLEGAIRHTSLGPLDLLASGRIPPNPSELLESRAFVQLLATVSVRYDVVLVDTPPVLAVADPAVVARAAGVNLLVLRAGRHAPAEIALTVKRLSQNGAEVHGAVLNDVRSAVGRYGRHGRYARYEYHSEGR